MYIPAVYTTWWTLALVARDPAPAEGAPSLRPWVFHAANVLVHAINAVTVLAILRMLVQRPWAAFAGAVLFAVHPLQVEPVAWATGMKDLLAGMLALLAIYQYIRFASPGKRKSLHYTFATVLLIAALFAKPAAIVVPFIAAILDLFVIGRPLDRVLKSVGLWLLLIVPCMIWTAKVQPVPEMIAPPLWARPLIAADAIAFYLYKLVWPMRLGIDYGRFPEMVISKGWIWFTWIVPAALTAVIVMLRRRWLSAAGLIFVAGVLPVLGLVPFTFQSNSTVADRYVYLSMLGPALAVAFGLAAYPGIACRIVPVILVLLALQAALQCRTWRNAEALMHHALDVNPRSPFANNNYGGAVFAQGQYEEADRRFEAAVAARPNYLHAVANLARTKALLNQPDQSLQNAVRTFALTASMPAGEQAPYINDLNETAIALMEHRAYAEAAEIFARLEERDPANPVYPNNLAVARKEMRRAMTRPVTQP